MSLDGYFGGRHVIVTGGSSGIGLALAEALARLGAEVTLVARREGPLLEAKAKVEAARPGAKVHALALDVADFDAVQAKLTPHLEARTAQMLINNAGVAMPGRFLEMDLAQYRAQMDINYFGAVHMCRAVVPHLVAQGQGHVCNVGSLLSVMGIYGYSAYAATKFALYGFSECLRAELKPLGIKVTMLLPPDTDTPQHAAEVAHLPAETKAIAGNVKMLTAEQVADTCLRGMAAGRFDVVPGLDGRMTVTANRWLPGVARWVCDNAAKKVASPRGEA